jgi:CRP-like cAMP-binding protein
MFQNVNDHNLRSTIRNVHRRRSSDRKRKLSSHLKREEKSFVKRIIDFRFHPNKGFKLRWDLLVIFLSVYNSFVIPLQFSIPDTFKSLDFFEVLDVCIDWLFFLDILIMFRTSYIDLKSEEIISDTKKICINYFQGRLLIDILASMPFETIARWFSTDLDPVTSNALSLLKLTRMLRLGRMISYFQVNQNFKFGMKMLQMFIIILIYLNLVACIWIRILAPPQVDSGNEEQLLLPQKLKFTNEEFNSSGDLFKYNLMLFMTLFNIMGNDISPTSSLVFWVSALLMLTGFLIVGNLIGEFSNILNEIYEADVNNEIEENDEMVTQTMHGYLIPEEL